MKEVLIISGKGGTGKTVLTGAFASIVENKILLDCDVDAADLHLLVSPSIKKRNVFQSGKTAKINANECVQCRQCWSVCRFGAISKDLIIDPVICDGCGFCSRICPQNAIDLFENECGQWFISDTRFGPFVHARLGIAEENTGKLVSLVRENGRVLASKKRSDWIIIDGPPGIGCPVISSMSGVHVALIVTEPTLSGLHDACRVIEVASHFQVPVKMVVNKYNINEEVTRQIKSYCQEKGIEVIGEIPFDKNIVKSMIFGKTIVEHLGQEYQPLFEDIWKKLICEPI